MRNIHETGAPSVLSGTWPRTLLLFQIVLLTATVGGCTPPAKRGVISVRKGETMRSSANIAWGKPCKFEPKPDFSSMPEYSSYTDPGDFTQLKLGEYDPSCSPTGRGIVGWRRGRVQVTIDLERVAPISGVSFRTFAGERAIYWPYGILILVSDDGERFYLAGELVSLSYRHSLPPINGWHTYWTDQLRTRGRYIRLVIHAMTTVVCHGIEVYRGDESLLTEERVGEPSSGVRSIIAAGATERGVRLRMLRDLADVRERVASSAIAANEKARIALKLDTLAESAYDFRLSDDSGFRSVLPLNSLHEEIYAIHAPVLRSTGFRDLTVWRRCRWDPLGPLDVPDGGTTKELPRLAIMPGQYQARVLNLTNPTDATEVVRISFAGLPESPTPSWVQPHEVLFTDTMYGRILATALEPLDSTEGAYTLTIPPGMTKQVWFRFHPTKVAPGDYEGTVVLQGNNARHTILLPVHISRLRFPEQVRCKTPLWDYTEDRGAYDLKYLGYKYKGVVIDDLKDHFTNVTWGLRRVTPLPTAAYFNDGHELVKPLDWRSFDGWVKFWEGGAKPEYYIVFLSLSQQTEFAGAEVGAPQFDARVRTWTAAWRKHVIETGLRPKQVGVLVWDEISRDEQAAKVLEWVRPMKAGYPELQIVQTLTGTQPVQSEIQELYDLVDVFIPALGHYGDDVTAAAATREYYAGHVARRGTQVWTYLNMHIALSDPYGHYRMLPWRAWTRGMHGAGFWAYGDAGRGSWNRYAVGTRPSYSPLFIGLGTVHDTKHWEAYREGLQDYEVLALLRDRLEDLKTQGRFSTDAARAERFLAEMPKAVEEATGAEWSIRLHWWKSKDRTIADDGIAHILDLMEVLSEE